LDLKCPTKAHVFKTLLPSYDISRRWWEEGRSLEVMPLKELLRPYPFLILFLAPDYHEMSGFLYQALSP
jgi:hypothetical protein